MEIKIESAQEKELRQKLAARPDAEARRMERFLAMPDLSRAPDSPLSQLVALVRQIPRFQSFDVIEIPEIIGTDILFDAFNFPASHPARSKSDTYYVDEANVLRTHDTVMWHYYFHHPAIQEKIKNKEPLAVLCYGKVYRKDEIDRKHMNIFHQFGGLYLVPNEKQTLTVDDLKQAISEITHQIFGPQVIERFNKDTFPYTDPSLEVEVDNKGAWVEILGAGMPLPSVLSRLGLTGYNGWAFGFGLERLAILSMELPDIRLLWSEDERVKKQLQLGQKYKEVSKYPAIVRDISFIVPSSFVPNNYFDLIRELGGDLIEEVQLLDKYENAAKFGADKLSYTYRITYRSVDRTLTATEIEPIQQKVLAETKQQFNAEIR